MLYFQPTLLWRRKKRFKSWLTRPQPPQEQDVTRCKMVQEGGRSLVSDLQVSNPFPNGYCGSVDCLMCSQEPSYGRCYKTNVGYQFECDRSPCNRETTANTTHPDPDRTTSDSEGEDDTNNNSMPPIRARYQGETSRTGYTRAKQHLELYRSRSTQQRAKSFMHKHTISHHDGIVGREGGIHDYKMTVTHTFRKPMDRILDEAVRIKHQEDQANCWTGSGEIGVESLNSKQDYFQSSCVRTNFSRGSQN